MQAVCQLNFDCDFVVAVFLNRGSKDGKKEKFPPKYYIFPVVVIEENIIPNDLWSKINITKIPNYTDYENDWNSIVKFLDLKEGIQ